MVVEVWDLGFHSGVPVSEDIEVIHKCSVE